MSKYEKLFERFIKVPTDFTWDELKKILSSFGYSEISKGKTAGSRKKFVDMEGNLILLHKPHPTSIRAYRTCPQYVAQRCRQRQAVPDSATHSSARRQGRDADRLSRSLTRNRTAGQ